MLFLSTVALPFLKTWWKVILPVVLLLLALGYVKVLHMEINHYKNLVIELKQEAAIVREKNNLLEHAATEQSKKYARQLENRLLEEQKKAKLVKERIKRDKESAAIHLSPNIISLFNAGKPDSEATPGTVSSDDGGASPAEKTLTSDERTLNQLLLISAENDANHLACIQQVKEWQHFWLDFKRSVEAVGGSP